MNDNTITNNASLELHKILDILSGFAVSSEGKMLCIDLTPKTDIETVSGLLAQTASARNLIIKSGSAYFGGLSNITNSLLRAEQGGTLNPSELLAVAGVYNCADGMIRYLKEDESKTLSAFLNLLTSNRYLAERITGSILSEDEIADSASSELSDIRRHIRLQSGKVRESLQKIITSPAYAKYLRDPIITMRADRFVVPVKSEFKNEIPGLVHDVSATGNTFFIEPISAVNANNSLRELFLKEKLEIERILCELTGEVRKYSAQLAANYHALLELDVIFAKAKYALTLDGAVPELRTDGKFELIRAKHPLLSKDTAVPVTITLGFQYDAIIVTGPNTGGKTVTLKTAGLLTLMTECGLMIPVAPGSSVNLFHKVFADIGDEQSIEQSLSTFSSHMRNIAKVIPQCDDNTLILFDELGAGTDPAEGAALAISLIEFCLSSGAKIVATTHYAELKLYALRTERVINASCEFDIETLKPTFRLLIGVPGKSNAFAISAKLGIPDYIITKASSLLNRNDKDFEEVLSQLEQQRSEMERAKADAEELRKETEKIKQKSESYYQELKTEREKMLASSRKEAQAILADARRAANDSYEELKKLKKEVKEAGAAGGNYNQKESEIRAALNAAEKRLYTSEQTKVIKKSSRPPVSGDTVEILKYGTKATVLSITKDGLLYLQAGIMKMTLSPDEVYLIDQPKINSAMQKHKVLPAPAFSGDFHNEAPELELDLRGMSSDEASIVLAQFLDRSFLSKIPSARIIHGKGTGILRKTVHDELKHSKYVKSFRLGTYGEGEDGVTIVEF